MTQRLGAKTNREIEEHYFEQFRQIYQLPKGVVCHGDKPDVIIHGTKKIGIEITNFYIQSGSLPDSEQRQRRIRDDVVSEAHRLYLAGGGKRIELTFGFELSKPITLARTKGLTRELAAIARANEGHPSGTLEMALFRSSPEISFVYINSCDYADPKWRVSQVHTLGLASKKEFEGIVRDKETKSVGYQKCDAYWLLIVVDWLDRAQDQEIRVDGLHVTSTVFEKIIIYKPGFEYVEM